MAAQLLLREKLQRLLARIIRDDCYSLFYDPVSAEDVPTYYETVKQPMFLSVVKAKLEAGEYRTASSFVDDVMLVFNNAIEFNPAGTDWHDTAKTIAAKFRPKLDAMLAADLEAQLASSAATADSSALLFPWPVCILAAALALTRFVSRLMAAFVLAAASSTAGRATSRRDSKRAGEAAADDRLDGGGTEHGQTAGQRRQRDRGSGSSRPRSRAPATAPLLAMFSDAGSHSKLSAVSTHAESGARAAEGTNNSHSRAASGNAAVAGGSGVGGVGVGVMSLPLLASSLHAARDHALVALRHEPQRSSALTGQPLSTSLGLVVPPVARGEEDRDAPHAVLAGPSQTAIGEASNEANSTAAARPFASSLIKGAPPGPLDKFIISREPRHSLATPTAEEPRLRQSQIAVLHAGPTPSHLDTSSNPGSIALSTATDGPLSTAEAQAIAVGVTSVSNLLPAEAQRVIRTAGVLLHRPVQGPAYATDSSFDSLLDLDAPSEETLVSDEDERTDEAPPAHSAEAESRTESPAYELDRQLDVELIDAVELVRTSDLRVRQVEPQNPGSAEDVDGATSVVPPDATVSVRLVLGQLACRFCGDSDSYADDPLLSCAGCHLRIHAYCIGVTEAELEAACRRWQASGEPVREPALASLATTGSAMRDPLLSSEETAPTLVPAGRPASSWNLHGGYCWLCPPCEAGLDTRSLACAVCPIRGGPLVPAVAGEQLVKLRSIRSSVRSRRFGAKRARRKSSPSAPSAAQSSSEIPPDVVTPSATAAGDASDHDDDGSDAGEEPTPNEALESTGNTLDSPAKRSKASGTPNAVGPSAVVVGGLVVVYLRPRDLPASASAALYPSGCSIPRLARVRDEKLVAQLIAAGQARLVAPSSVPDTWLHVTCAMYLPEPLVDDLFRFRKIRNLAKIAPDRWRYNCRVCGTKAGAVIQCVSPACGSSYHAQCARDGGALMFFRWNRDGNAGAFSMFCTRHDTRPPETLPHSQLIARKSRAEQRRRRRAVLAAQRAQARSALQLSREADRAVRRAWRDAHHDVGAASQPSAGAALADAAAVSVASGSSAPMVDQRAATAVVDWQRSRDRIRAEARRARRIRKGLQSTMRRALRVVDLVRRAGVGSLRRTWERSQLEDFGGDEVDGHDDRHESKGNDSGSEDSDHRSSARRKKLGSRDSSSSDSGGLGDSGESGSETRSPAARPGDASHLKRSRKRGRSPRAIPGASTELAANTSSRTSSGPAKRGRGTSSRSGGRSGVSDGSSSFDSDPGMAASRRGRRGGRGSRAEDRSARHRDDTSVQGSFSSGEVSDSDAESQNEWDGRAVLGLDGVIGTETSAAGSNGSSGTAASASATTGWATSTVVNARSMEAAWPQLRAWFLRVGPSSLRTVASRLLRHRQWLRQDTPVELPVELMQEAQAAIAGEDLGALSSSLLDPCVALPGSERPAWTRVRSVLAHREFPISDPLDLAMQPTVPVALRQPDVQANASVARPDQCGPCVSAAALDEDRHALAAAYQDGAALFAFLRGDGPGELDEAPAARILALGELGAMLTPRYAGRPPAVDNSLSPDALDYETLRAEALETGSSTTEDPALSTPSLGRWYEEVWADEDVAFASPVAPSGGPSSGHAVTASAVVSDGHGDGAISATETFDGFRDGACFTHLRVSFAAGMSTNHAVRQLAESARRRGVCTNTTFRFAEVEDAHALHHINRVNPLYASPQAFAHTIAEKNEFVILAQREHNAVVGFVNYYFMWYSGKRASEGGGSSSGSGRPRSSASVRHAPEKVCYVATLQAVKRSTHDDLMVRDEVGGHGALLPSRADTPPSASPAGHAPQSLAIQGSAASKELFVATPAASEDTDSGDAKLTDDPPEADCAVSASTLENRETRSSPTEIDWPDIRGEWPALPESESRTGTLLMLLACRHAASVGIRWVLIDSTADAVPFYERILGFHRTAPPNPRTGYQPMRLDLATLDVYRPLCPSAEVADSTAMADPEVDGARSAPTEASTRILAPSDENDDEVCEELRMLQQALTDRVVPRADRAVTDILLRLHEREAIRVSTAERRQLDDRVWQQWARVVDRVRAERELAEQQAEEDEFATCAVCGGGESFPRNQILFCDSCNLAGHQACIGVPVIPDGQWFCDCCAAAIGRGSLPDGVKPPAHSNKPRDVRCLLCPVRGGALKPTDPREGRRAWCHVLCARVIEVMDTSPPVGAAAVIATRTENPSASTGARLQEWEQPPIGFGEPSTLQPVVGLMAQPIVPSTNELQAVTDRADDDLDAARMALLPSHPADAADHPLIDGATAPLSDPSAVESPPLPAESPVEVAPWLTRWAGKHPCSVCGLRYGVTVPCCCAAVGCSTWVHPMCALQHGLFAVGETHASVGVASMSVSESLRTQRGGQAADESAITEPPAAQDAGVPAAHRFVSTVAVPLPEDTAAALRLKDVSEPTADDGSQSDHHPHRSRPPDTSSATSTAPVLRVYCPVCRPKQSIARDISAAARAEMHDARGRRRRRQQAAAGVSSKIGSGWHRKRGEAAAGDSGCLWSESWCEMVPEIVEAEFPSLMARLGVSEPLGRGASSAGPSASDTGGSPSLALSAVVSASLSATSGSAGGSSDSGRVRQGGSLGISQSGRARLRAAVTNALRISQASSARGQQDEVGSGGALAALTSIECAVLTVFRTIADELASYEAVTDQFRSASAQRMSRRVLPPLPRHLRIDTEVLSHVIAAAIESAIRSSQAVPDGSADWKRSQLLRLQAQTRSSVRQRTRRAVRAAVRQLLRLALIECYPDLVPLALLHAPYAMLSEAVEVAVGSLSRPSEIARSLGSWCTWVLSGRPHTTESSLALPMQPGAGVGNGAPVAARWMAVLPSRPSRSVAMLTACGGGRLGGYCVAKLSPFALESGAYVILPFGTAPWAAVGRIGEDGSRIAGAGVAGADSLVAEMLAAVGRSTARSAITLGSSVNEASAGAKGTVASLTSSGQADPPVLDSCDDGDARALVTDPVTGKVEVVAAEEDTLPFCVCRKTWKEDDSFSMMCSACGEWFHAHCLAFTEIDTTHVRDDYTGRIVDITGDWMCRKCVLEVAKARFSRPAAETKRPSKRSRAGR